MNQEGVTIILVTHDEHVARHARRIVHIRDGQVETDEASPGPVTLEAAADQAPEISRRSLWAWPRLRWMLRTALHGLRRNYMRAALTTLGIIIGVAAVIAMMEIGRGSSSAIQKTIASMGANILLIMPGTATSGGVSFGSGSVMTLTPQDADAISKEAPAVRADGPRGAGPHPGHLRQQELGAHLHLREHPGLPGGAGMARGRRGDVLGPGRPKRQQGLRSWASASSRSCSTASPRWAKKSG